MRYCQYTLHVFSGILLVSKQYSYFVYVCICVESIVVPAVYTSVYALYPQNIVSSHTR